MDVEISVFSVFNHLTHLSRIKAIGSDEISSRVLCECASTLSESISHLFNLSVANQKIPHQWKLAHVIPVPKWKVKSLDDIRPISLLPIIFKILESLVVESVKEKLIKCYGQEQFGFHQQSSTLLANIAVTDFIAKSLDRDQSIGAVVISFDMSRAFDPLKHFTC